MSIYATLWEIKIPRRHEFDEEWVEIYAQAVPPHIGHPSHYPEGDPYADFLPPVVQDYDAASGEAPYDRAVLIIQRGRDRKDVQRYVDPLLVMSGEEYERIPFGQLLKCIHKAVGWDERVFAKFIGPDGQTKILRSSGEATNEDEH